MDIGQPARALHDDLVLGLPRPAYVIFAVEFAERLGYYAVAFSLFTYGRHMLGISATGMQAIMNTIYLVVPAAACASSGLADGAWGRARTLMTFLVAYAVGLTFLTVSSLPCLFGSFPLQALAGSYVLLAIALCLFALGYGGMKVCTNPMMADSVAATYKAIFAEENAAASAALEVRNEGAVGAYGTYEGVAAREQAGSPEGTNAQPPPANTFLSEIVESQKAELERVLARAFHFVYWVSNVGSLFGIFAAPLMRDWDSRRVTFGSDEYTTGYYYGFAMATLSVVVGLLFFYQFRSHFPRNEPVPSFLFFRLVGRAVKIRLLLAMGTIRVSDLQYRTSTDRDFLAYGLCGVEGSAPGGKQPSPLPSLASSSSPSTVLTASAEDTGQPPRGQQEGGGVVGTGGSTGGDGSHGEGEQWLADCRATLRVCKAFVALPIYWLITNQYSTSLMFSLEALDLPPSIPPDLFNNINTFTLLVFIALCDRVIYPCCFRMKRGSRGPSPRARIVSGFLLVVVSMVWCGVVQIAIARRGTYVGAEGKYEVDAGRAQLSAGWMVVPYILQGIAAALVDPASMEVAYTAAPEHMKGTVMALYWIASSASGFLGLVLSPVMKPENGVALYFSFASALLLVTGLFYALNASGAYANAALDAVEAQLMARAAMTTPPPAARQQSGGGEDEEGEGREMAPQQQDDLQLLHNAREEVCHLRVMVEADDPYDDRRLTK